MATTFRINSLSNRIVSVVALILVLAGSLFGWTFYRTVRNSVYDEMNSELRQRMAWLRASVELDERGKLEFEPKMTRANVPRNWRISTLDGKVLWLPRKKVEQFENDGAFKMQSEIVELGERNGTVLISSDIQLASAGSDDQFESYATGNKRGQLSVILSVRAPIAPLESELDRIALALWTIGPASIVALVAILALFIRWQHAPLKTMSLQSAAIGPADTTKRIGPSGSSEELVRLRESINAMVGRMAAGMERERQFSSMAAHELRTPLTQMRMNVEIALSKERSAADYKESLGQSLEDIERLQRLVTQLLFLTRDHHGPEMCRDVSLPNAVELSVKSCRSNAVIRSDLSGLVVAGNDELIQCAIRNVLENAMRYAPGEPVEIVAVASADTIELQIIDRGPGVPGADCERIFEPLTRLDEARTIGAEADGFGLGLTVARNAMRACGGELICRASPDGKRGAAFVFSFKRVASRGT